MKLATRLLLAWLMMAALLVLLMTAGILSASSMHASLEENAGAEPAADPGPELAVLIERGHGAAYSIAHGDPSGAAARRWTDARDALVALIAARLATTAPDSDESKALLQLREQHDSWTAALEALPKGGNSAASGAYWTQLEPAARQLSEHVAQMRDSRDKRAQKAASHSRDIAWRSRTLMATMAAIAVFAMLWIASHLQRTLLEPLSTMAAGSLALGTGEPHRRLHHPHDDELGQLARRINDLSDQLEAFRSRSKQLEVLEQQVARALLDRFERPCALVDHTGALVAANEPFRAAVRTTDTAGQRGAWEQNLSQQFELRRLTLQQDSGQPLGELLEIVRPLTAAQHPRTAQPAATST
jgi:HAMP domain-containing protein